MYYPPIRIFHINNSSNFHDQLASAPQFFCQRWFHTFSITYCKQEVRAHGGEALQKEKTVIRSFENDARVRGEQTLISTYSPSIFELMNQSLPY